MEVHYLFSMYLAEQNFNREEKKQKHIMKFIWNHSISLYKIPITYSYLPQTW